jgi:SAM-dependent methyltransferase
MMDEQNKVIDTNPAMPWPSASPELSSETEVWWQRQNAYFDAQRENNKMWRARIGYPIDVRGKSVLDLGCGHGALSVALAQEGAKSVLGIDLDTKRVHYAKTMVQRFAGSFPGDLTFSAIDLNAMEGSGLFDVVVTKDCFEHVDDLPTMLSSINRLLKPNGILVAGFSPLYYSPFGDHGRWELKLPWLHSVLPESVLAAYLRRKGRTGVRNASDLGLNKLTYPKFAKIMDSPAWHPESVRINVKDGLGAKAFTLLRKVPALEKYFTISVYAVYRKQTTP